MIQRPFRYYYLRVTRQRGTPENVALGMAIGVFIGLLLPIGQILVAVFAATVIKANRVTAFIGTWVSNPLTYVLLISFYLYAGQLVTGIKLKKYLNTLPTANEQVNSTTPAEPQTEALDTTETPDKKKLPRTLDELISVVRTNGFPFVFRLIIVWLAAAVPCGLIGSALSYHFTRAFVESFRRKQVVRRAKKRAKRERKAAEEEAIRGIHMGLDDQ